MAISSSAYDVDTDRTLSQPDSAASGGDGGGVMDIWQDTRVNQINNLLGGNFTNSSSFDIPAGVAGDGYDNTFDQQERFMGINVQGQSLDVDGTPLSGTAKIEDDGDVIKEKSVANVFIINGGPPSGVSNGDSDSPTSYDFRFEPSITGIDNFVENFGTITDVGKFQYGEVTGTVTDVDGDVVANVGISAEGIATSTDSNGGYRLVGPGGKSVTISAIGESKSANITQGGSAILDFQYGRLTITVISPNGRLVSGARVRVGGNRYTTDEGGQVVIDPAEIRDFNIEVGDAVTDTLTIQSEGEDVSQSYGNAFASVEVTATDVASSDNAENVPVTIKGPGSPIDAKTGSNGIASPLYDSGGEVDVVIADEDKRYLSEEVSVSVTLGEVEQVNSDLQRKDNISTF